MNEFFTKYKREICLAAIAVIIYYLYTSGKGKKDANSSLRKGVSPGLHEGINPHVSQT